MVPLTLLLLATVPHALAGPEGCSEVVGPGEIKSALEDAESAYADLDLDKLLASTDTLQQRVGCVDGPIGAALAARIHRIRGLRAFVDDDVERAKLAFAAARAAEPGYRFPESIIPAGNPALDLYDAVPLSIGVGDAAPAPLEGQLTFDGLTGDQRPAGWPTVAQHIVDAEVRASAYLWPGDPMFDYPMPELPPDAVGRTPEWGGLQTGLASAGGAAALTGIVAYALAVGSANTYDSAETDPGDLEGLRTTTNRRVLIASGAGVAAVTLGGVAVLTWQF